MTTEKPRFHWRWAVQLVQDIAENHTSTNSVDGTFQTKADAEKAGMEAQKRWPSYNRMRLRRVREWVRP